MSEDLTNQGTLEMQKLIGFLLTNGYKFEGLEEANYYENGHAYSEPTATMCSFKSKSFFDAYTNITGNSVNDSDIKIKIIYNNDFDNLQKEDTYYDKEKTGDDDDGNPEYEYTKKTNLKASKKFINRLIKGESETRGESQTKGGTRRRRRK